MGIFDALAAGDLTTLRVLRDCNGKFSLTASRLFEPDWDFRDYGRRYAVDQVPCANTRALGDADTRKLLEKHSAGPDLAALLDGMRRGKHEMVWLCAHDRLGLRVAHFIHSSTLGLRQPQHALRAGGIRRYDRDADEGSALAAGLNLSRAMSYKCAQAELPYGGSKTALFGDPIAGDDAAQLGFLAYCIDSGHLMTGPDVGLSGELIDALSARYTPNILCGTSTPMGSTGAPTAEGIFIAVRAAAAFLWNSSKLEGRSAVVQGLGSVGLALLERLSAAGMQVSAYDPDPERVALAQAAAPALKVLPPEHLLTTKCDLLAPCAMGGVIGKAQVPELNCKLIYGAANNILAADCIEDEIVLAKALAARNILTQPDWSVTVGGVIAGHEERTNADHASIKRVHAALRRICGAKTTELLATAADRNITPTELAYERIHATLADANEP
jgi:leucine dehydrogenase